jgi:hypothetical protein
LIEVLLGALAESVFGLLLEDLSHRTGLANLREKLKGGSPEKLAFQHAIVKAYISFSSKYPALVVALFDGYFLQKPEIVYEFTKLLRPNQTPDTSIIVQAWRAQFSSPIQIDLLEPISFFITAIENEIKSEPLLKPFIDSRAFEQLYVIAQRNQEQVMVQQQIRDLLVDINKLLKGIVGSKDITNSGDETKSFSTKPPNIQEKLIDLLLKMPVFLDKQNRDALLFKLDDLSGAIPRSNMPVVDIVSIINSLSSVGRLNTGEWPLYILIQNAQRFCPPNTDNGRQLKSFLDEYGVHQNDQEK